MSPTTQLDALAHELGAFIDLLEQESGALAANQADNLAPLILQRESANLRLSRLWQALALDMGQAAGTSMEALRERCQALAPEHWQRVEEKLRHAQRMEVLVPRVTQNEGYNLFSLTRASAVVNCQSALAWFLLRLVSQAATSSINICLSGIRRSRH